MRHCWPLRSPDLQRETTTLSDIDASVDLRGRIGKVLKDFAPAMPKPEIVWCADAIVTEIAAFRLEVSEDEFLDAVASGEQQ